MNEYGVNLPNGGLTPGDWPAIRALGCAHYLALVPDDPTPAIADVFTILADQPDARIHLRLWQGSALGDPAKAAKKVADLHGKLGDHVWSWRLGNEPNLELAGVTPTVYAAWLIALAQAVRAACPTVRLHAPAMSPGAGGWLNWVRSAAQAARQARLAGLDVHAYGPPADALAILDRVAGQAPDQSLLVTEYNYGAGRAYDVARYAEDVPAFYAGLARRKVSAALVFTWRWDSPDVALPTTVNVQDMPAVRAAITAATGGPSNTQTGASTVPTSEIERYADDIFKRAGVPLNAESAFFKYFLAALTKGRFLGFPMEAEHKSESGHYTLQAYANTILYCGGDAVVKEGLPPLS